MKNPSRKKSSSAQSKGGASSQPQAHPAAEPASEPGFADLGFARVDLRRARTKGFPEVVYGEGKSAAQLLGIARTLLAHDPRLLITRLSPNHFAALRRSLPTLRYHALAACAFAWPEGQPLGLALTPVAKGEVGIGTSIDARKGAGETAPSVPDVLVVTAGTLDLPCAEEAALTAALLGCQVARLCDVGVAGLHRLLAHVELLRRARCLVVAAGMDAALASVITGLTPKPVIGLPTPIGYGHGGAGQAALGSMLQACAPGLTVVNIGNGFGAGYAAAQIALACR